MNSLIYQRGSLGFATPIASAVAGGTAAATSAATLGISAAVMFAGQGIQAWIQSNRLRGQQKIGATTIANLVEGKLKELKDGYEASRKTRKDWEYAKGIQAQLLDYFQGPDGCGNAQLGSAGQRCLSERLCKGCAYPWLEWYDLGPAPEGAASENETGLFEQSVFGSGTSLGASSVTPFLIAGAGLLLIWAFSE